MLMAVEEAPKNVDLTSDQKLQCRDIGPRNLGPSKLEGEFSRREADNVPMNQDLVESCGAHGM